MDAFTSSELAAYVDARMTGFDQVSKQPSNAKGGRRLAATGYLVAITSFLMKGWGYQRLGPVLSTQSPPFDAVGIYDMLLLNYGDAPEAGPYLNQANPGGPTQPETSGTGKERELVIAIGPGGVPTGITAINYASIIARPGASGWRIKLRFKPNYGWSGGTIARFRVSRVTTSDESSRQYISGEGAAVSYSSSPTFAWEISSATIGSWNEKIMLVNVLPEIFPNLQFDAAFECFNHLFSLGLPVGVTGSDVDQGGGFYALTPNPFFTKADPSLRVPVFDAEVIVYRRAPMLVRYLVTYGSTGFITTLPTTLGFGTVVAYNAATSAAIAAAKATYGDDLVVVQYVGQPDDQFEVSPGQFFGGPKLWVDFIDDSITSNQKIGWLWTFGDGTTDSPANNSRKFYLNCGTFVTGLQVTDSSGGDTYNSGGNSRVMVIIPRIRIQTAQNTLNPRKIYFAPDSDYYTSGTAAFVPYPAVVRSAGTGTTFLWEFIGIGNVTTECPTITFTPGTWTIRLTVTAPNGMAVTETIQLSIF